MKAEALQQAALDVAQAHCPERVIHGIATNLAREPGVALARIWLKAPGDVCDECTVRALCPDRTECLHLAASAGSSLADPGGVLVLHRWAVPPLPTGRAQGR